MNEDKLKTNRNKWNKSFNFFTGWCALPTWGPFETGADDPSLIGEIKNKTFVEICCGSGHSIKYLLDNGAKKVYAIDFSDEQLNLARELNKEYLQQKKVEFFLQPMEEPIQLPEQVDTVFSIYGIGWSLDPKKTFVNVFKYLKPGGRFIWSWDHKIFADAIIESNKVVIQNSYYDESELKLISRTGEEVYITYRKISTWFALLREVGFTVNRYLEPRPLNLKEDITLIAGQSMADYYDLKKVEKLPCVMIFEAIKPE